MFKHLKFIDGTSDKFWEIQTNGATHTVTYGRNGTAGQSKDKTFDNEETCIQDAEKLIKEKTKKGYSEDGTVEVAPQVTKEGTVRKPNASVQRKEEAVKRLKALISAGGVSDIIPYLEEYASGNLEVIKKEIRAAKRYWVDYVDLSKDPLYKSKAQYDWGIRGTKEQQRMVKLLALATFNGSDAASWDVFIELINQVRSPEVDQILTYAKPNWLTPYLLQYVQKNSWQSINYDNLRYAESKGFLEFEPELYANSLSKSHHPSPALLDLFTTDELTIQRDIPLVFEYETQIHNVYWNYRYENQVNELTWDKIFDQLLADNKIAKAFILTSALEVQTKNWNTNLKSYFRKLIDRIGVDEKLLLEHQELFFPLLHAENSAVINFVVDTLKPYFAHADFRLEEFLTWSEGIFMRNDIKTAVKTLLIQFDKLVKIRPEVKEQFILQAADVFMVQDLQLQDRAAKFILKHQKQPIEALTEKLTLYSAQMLGGIPADLKCLTASSTYTEQEILSELMISTGENYVFDPIVEKKLQQPFIYPTSWNDILFKIGEVINSTDAVQMEILMNAWVVQRAIFPADYKEQLEPYINQLKKVYRESQWFQHFSGVFLNMYFQPTKIYQNTDRYSNYSKWASMIGEQLTQLQRHIAKEIQLPLLSLPTHEPFWIAPQIVVQRILDYQDKGVALDLLDLSIALSRTVREDLDGIVALIDQINDSQVRSVLTYALGLDDELKIEKKSWVKKLLSASDSAHVGWLGVWATVARTHYPEAVFSEFEHENLKEIPFAVAPFRPELMFTPSYYQGYNYQTRKSEMVYDGEKLSFHFPNFKQEPNTFIYHKDIYQRGKDSVHSYYLYQDDISYMHSVMPQNTESLSLFLTLGLAAKADQGGKTPIGYLKEMLYDFFHFDQQSVLFLATSTFNKEKEVRAMAIEVLITAIDRQRLPVQDLGNFLGILMSHTYGPLGRLEDVLGQCRDISSKHNQALIKIIEYMFLSYAIGEKMPTNFKKLIELYYDLVHKENQNISVEIKEVFEKLMIFKSLQPILKKLSN